ncbi:MAG: hypothetical protein ACOCUL_03480, partial [Bacteroidota bacterium]
RKSIRYRIISLIKNIRKFRNGELNVTLNNNGCDLIISHIGGVYYSFLSGLIGNEVAFYNVRFCGTPYRYKTLKTTKVYEL